MNPIRAQRTINTTGVFLTPWCKSNYELKVLKSCCICAKEIALASMPHLAIWAQTHWDTNRLQGTGRQNPCHHMHDLANSGQSYQQHKVIIDE